MRCEQEEEEEEEDKEGMRRVNGDECRACRGKDDERRGVRCENERMNE